MDGWRDVWLRKLLMLDQDYKNQQTPQKFGEKLVVFTNLVVIKTSHRTVPYYDNYTRFM